MNTHPATLDRVENWAKRAARLINRIRFPTTRLSVVRLLGETFKEVQQDHLGAFAGNLTYHGLFALFPFLVFLLSLLAVFHATELVNALLVRIHPVVPHGAYSVIKSQILPLAQTRATGAFTIGAVVAVLFALWGISSGFRSMMEAMNAMYDVPETRPLWKQFAVSLVLSLAAIGLLIFALTLLVFGKAIAQFVADQLGLGAVFTLAWAIAQWPILIGFVLLAFALIYRYAPDVHRPFHLFTPGSVIAVLLWLIFSFLFSIYVGSFGSFNATYGGLAGVAVLLLYMYYSSFILLVGAEINHVIWRLGKPASRDQDGEKLATEANKTGIARSDEPRSA